MTVEEDSIPNGSALMRMATAYLARYSASSRRVRQVVERRIRRRCVEQGLDSPDENALAAALDGLVDRLVELGLLDDTAFAAGRARALQRKGLPERRVRAALQGEGLDGDVIDSENAVPDEVQARRYAARKRLGPFRARERSAFRDKDLRSLLRAGFSFALATATIDGEPDEA